MRDLRAQRSPPLIPASPVLKVLPPAARHVLRGGEPARTRVQNVLGIGVPTQPCRSARIGERAVLWLGPDEWLLLAPEHDAQRHAAALGEALASLPCALVDVSHRQVGLSVGGAQAETLLSAGCPLD